MLKSTMCAAVLILLLAAPNDVEEPLLERYHHTAPAGLMREITPEEQELMGVVATAFRSAGKPAPELDINIALACRKLCLVLDCRDIDSVHAWEPQTIQFTLRTFGITDSFYFPLVAQLEDPSEAEELLIGLVESDLLAMGVNRFGLALDEQDDTMFAAIFTKRLVQLGPFPKQVEPGSTHLLWGGLLEGSASPAFILSTPDDALFQKPVKMSKGIFWTDVYFPDDPGKYVVEVLVSLDGPQVASLFPIYVGIPVPPRPVFKVYPGIDEAGDRHSLEQQIYKLINRERRKRELEPCKWNKPLATSARAYSRTMAKAGRLSHVLPTSGYVLKAEYTENISLSTSLHAAHANLMASPSHRRNLLDRDARYCGVGVAPVTKEDGSRLLYITQRFASGRATLR